MAGNESRQHARVGRLHIARQQRDAHVRRRLLAEALQDVHVSVPAADQHELLDDRRDAHDSD